MNEFPIPSTEQEATPVPITDNILPITPEVNTNIPEEVIDHTENTDAIIKTNFNRIKNQLGEPFAKEIRGSFTEYLSKEDFPVIIREIIPNKYKALETLQDNYEYVSAELKKRFIEEDKAQEVAPKNPFELAKSVGYELIHPLKTIEEIEAFKSDFRPGEQLCSFNDISSRIRAYHILWLRHQNADNIRPADELDNLNLTEEWKEYLKKQNRYNESTNKYNLNGLLPRREDPYGTSSMSVQISKSGSHVSIKNRYNHTVNSPDATLDNNLNNLAPDLKQAIYTMIGREDLLRVSDIPLAHGYIKDNKGGIHPYFYEKNNIYYGYHEIIQNGKVTIIDPAQYDMLSQALYLKKGKNSNELINLDTDEYSYHESHHKINSDFTHSITFLRNNKEIFRYNYSINEKGKIEDLEMVVHDQTGITFHDNPAISKLIFSKEIEGGLDLSRLTTAEGLTLPSSIEGELYLNGLTTAEGLKLPSSIGGSLYLDGLTTAEGLTLPSSIGEDLYLNGLTTAEGLTLPSSIGGDLYLDGLTTAEGLTLPSSIGGTLSLDGLTTAEGLNLPSSIGGTLSLNELTTAEGLTLPSSIGGSLSLDGLTTAEGLTLPSSIGGSLSLGGLTTAEGLTLPSSIGRTLFLNGLTTAKGLKFPSSIGATLYLDGLTTTEGLTLPSSIGGSLSLGGLTTAEGLTLPSSIGGSLSLGGLTTAEGLNLPSSIGADLYLNGLTTAKGLILPPSIKGYIFLFNLTTAEGLTVPQKILNKLPQHLQNQLKNGVGTII